MLILTFYVIHRCLAPSAPPKMYGGGFRIDSVCTASHARDCQVTIMWKVSEVSSFCVNCPIVKTLIFVIIRYKVAKLIFQGIEKYYQNGIIRFYTVQIRSGENIVVSKNESYNTYQYTYPLYKNETFSVSVTGTTDAGKSPPSNYIVTICKYFTQSNKCSVLCFFKNTFSGC